MLGSILFLFLWGVIIFPLVVVCDAQSTFPVTVAIQYDRYPDETAWSLECGNIVHAYHPSSTDNYYLSEQLVVETYQVQYGAECIFTISDDWGDGVCCDSGNGWYKVIFGVQYLGSESPQHNIAAEGGEFDHHEEFIFVAEHKVPTFSPMPSLSPSLEPTTMPSSTLEPSANPSKEPTIVPTTSSAPTGLTCPVTVVVELDGFPEETAISLQCGDVVYANHTFGYYSGQHYELTEDTFQIEQGLDCLFSIYDKFGDGICCDFGDGFFELFQGETQLVHGPKFGFQYNYSFVAAPLEPTVSPAPTLSPSFQPTTMPSMSASPTIFSGKNHQLHSDEMSCSEKA